MSLDTNKPFILGNWKMYLSLHEAESLARRIAEIASQPGYKALLARVGLGIAPSFSALKSVSEIIRHTDIYTGAQNVSQFETGPYTGEESAKTLHDLKVQFSLVGHFERRKYFSEHGKIIADKINVLTEHGITPVLCLGESIDIKKQKGTNEFLQQQMDETLTEVVEPEKVVIAYEPLWAMSYSTHEIEEDPKEIAETVALLIHHMTAMYHSPLPLILGGSINKHNASIFKKIPGVKGFLVGHASVNTEELFDIALELSA